MIADCFHKRCADCVAVPTGSTLVAHWLCCQPCGTSTLSLATEALAGAGLSSRGMPQKTEACGHVREGLEPVKQLVNKVTEHLKTLLGESGASGSQGPLLMPLTPAMVIPGPLVPEAAVDQRIVFMTMANINSKGTVTTLLRCVMDFAMQ